MLALVLQRQGHEVHIAYDGEAAIELASAVRPSAVCIDIGLPGIDGYQVATALRERGETRDAKLIALTGYGQVDDEARSLKAGFDHHLVKPVNPADLQALLRAPR
jgi:DNA-binding response OmpR family regulator